MDRNESEKKEKRYAKIEDLYVKKNTYRLSVGDLDWIGKNQSLSSIDILKGLLKRRFDNIDLRKFNKKRYADVATKFLENNKRIFSKSYPRKNYYKTYFLLPTDAHNEKISKFKEVVLGFSSGDVQNEKKYLTKDKKLYLRKIDEKINENEKLKKKSKKEGLKKEEEYKNNIENLKWIRKNEVEVVFLDPEIAARLRCRYKVEKERGHVFDLSPVREIEFDYLHINPKLWAYDASVIDFPLRFLGNITIDVYEGMRLDWKEGTSKEELIESIEIQDEEFFDKYLRRVFKVNLDKINKERLDLLEEIKYCYLNEKYASTTVLTLTQIEGILWDLADYLNKRRRFIYKKKKKAKLHYYPYLWDEKTNKYKKVKKTGYPEYEINNYLTSARDLLEKTRVREFLPKLLVSYFINEFFDERNQIMYGRLELLTEKTTATSALLALFALLDFMKDIKLNKKK